MTREAEEPAQGGAGYYAVDDGHGNQLTIGLQPHNARKLAQAMADDRHISVYLYEVGSDEEAEEFEPECTGDSLVAR